MRVAVVGTGYVGLVTGTCLADMGHQVVCQDIDADKIKGLRQGKLPIYEPGLGELVEENLRSEQLRFTTELGAALDGAQVCFVAVGTPPDEDGSADLKHVLAVARRIAELATGDLVFAIKSTVPVGTCDQVATMVEQVRGERGVSFRYDVVSNPEFLKEGMAVQDFMRPGRIVVGASTERAGDHMKRLYEAFVRNGHPCLVMDVRSSEMTKYASNVMLAARISMMNEIARVCSETGADIANVRRGVGSDKRLGMSFLYAGLGYGGSCFPKDIAALAHTASELGLETPMLNAVSAVNRQQKLWLVEQVVARFGEDLSGHRFALWGLAFKPKTDDVREAPALETIRGLLARGASVAAYDPEATDNAKSVLGTPDNLHYATSLYDAAEGASAILLATEWGIFRNPDWERLSELVKEKFVFDGRNQYEPSRMAERGFGYRCVGRPEV